MKKNWKNTALQKQLNFKKQIGLTKSGKFRGKTYEHILNPFDAAAFANFYCYQKDIDEDADFDKWLQTCSNNPIYIYSLGMQNMLRSEHIPHNFLFPLEKLRKTKPQLVAEFLEELFNHQIKIDEITRIKIEFAGDVPKEELLKDLTSFDAYIEYKYNDDLCGLGIEFKYTEKSYPFGKTEYKRMYGIEEGEYLPLTSKSGIYKKDAIEKLRARKLKQPWRNHLLGLKMVEIGELQQFHSVHIYPEGNTYQTEVCNEYQDCLNEKSKETFLPITFENFISIAEFVLGKNEYIKNINWINYLKNRY